MLFQVLILGTLLGALFLRLHHLKLQAVTALLQFRDVVISVTTSQRISCDSVSSTPGSDFSCLIDKSSSCSVVPASLDLFRGADNSAGCGVHFAIFIS